MEKGIKYPFSKQLIFAKVMENEEICKEFLERIFADRKIKEIAIKEKVSLVPEATIITGINTKSVRMDVLFEDEEAWYDVEMQVEDENDLPKRCRYYSSALDAKTLKRGQAYDSLKACYIIFICQFDYFERGNAIYFFEKYDEKKSLPMGDQSYTIIVNTKCIDDEVPESLRTLFDYINEGKIQNEDGFIKKIHREVGYLQEDEEVKHIMTLEEEYERRITAAEKRASKRGMENGFAQGLKQGLEQGLEKGLEQGLEMLKKSNHLTQILLDQNRIQDLKKAISDGDYQQQLFAEFNL